MTKEQLKNLAQNMQQQLNHFMNNEAAYSVDVILANLEAGNFNIYQSKLEDYAEELYSSAAEMARDILEGTEEEADADKAIDKYNEVNDTLSQLRSLSESMDEVNVKDNVPVQREQQEHSLKSRWEAAVEEVLAAAAIEEPDFEMEM